MRLATSYSGAPQSQRLTCGTRDISWLETLHLRRDIEGHNPGPYSTLMQIPAASVSSRSAPTAHMQGSMVLLKVKVGAREGWSVMALDDFIQKLDLKAWRSEERLIGTILPRAERRMLS